MCSSVHTVPGRTGKWNCLTGPCKPSGPTGSPSEAINDHLEHIKGTSRGICNRDHYQLRMIPIGSGLVARQAMWQG